MMSWDGKVTAFFEVMGKLTIRYLEIHGVPKEFGSGNTETQSFDSNMAKIMEWRSHPVRAMIRHLVLRNPLLFGTSITRIEERSELFFRHGLEWNKLNFVIKRSPAQHTKWLEKNDNSSALLGKLLKKEYPVFTLDDLYGNDGNIFSSVNPFNKPNFLSELTPQLYNQVKELNARLDEEVQRDRKSTALLQLPQQAGASAGGDFLLQKIERLEKILDASLEPLPRLEQISILDKDSSSLSSIRKRRLHRKKKKI